MNQNPEPQPVSVPTPTTQIEDEFILSLGRMNTAYRAVSYWMLTRLLEVFDLGRYHHIDESGSISARINKTTQFSVFQDTLRGLPETTLYIGTENELDITVIAGVLNVPLYRESPLNSDTGAPVQRYRVTYREEWSIFDLSDPEIVNLSMSGGRILLPGQNMRIEAGIPFQLVGVDGCVALIHHPNGNTLTEGFESIRYAPYDAKPQQPKARFAHKSDVRSCLNNARNKWEQNTTELLRVKG